MPQLFSDGARGELLSGISAADTAFNLSFGGALFPVATNPQLLGDWFKAVIQDNDGIEIVYVGAHAAGSDSFSGVLRGQEGTTARAFEAGSVVGLRVTAADMGELISAARPVWWGRALGCWGDGNPNTLMNNVLTNAQAAATPTNITPNVIRLAYFYSPVALQAAGLRYFGVGATSNIYRAAIYKDPSGAGQLFRQSSVSVLNTSVNSWGWSSLVSESGGQLVLDADTTYAIGVSVTTTGATAGPICLTPNTTATSGRIAMRRRDLPTNLRVHAHMPYIEQAATTAGDLPATISSGSLVAPAVWTGGFPAIWVNAQML